MTVPVLILAVFLLAAMVLVQARRIRVLNAQLAQAEYDRDLLGYDLYDYAKRYGSPLSDSERASLEDLAKRLTQ
jgi:hypothetical protein